MDKIKLDIIFIGHFPEYNRFQAKNIYFTVPGSCIFPPFSCCLPSILAFSHSPPGISLHILRQFLHWLFILGFLSIRKNNINVLIEKPRLQFTQFDNRKFPTVSSFLMFKMYVLLRLLYYIVTELHICNLGGLIY